MLYLSPNAVENVCVDMCKELGWFFAELAQ
jgi:hypothetical protein